MGVNFIELQNKIKSDTSCIETILDKLGYHHIVEHPDHYSAANSDGDNMNALVIYKDSLKYSNYTRGHSGNIISLVMSDKQCTFPIALEKISNWIGYKGSGIITKLPFNGFYKNIIAEDNGYIPDMKVYEWSSLPSPNYFSKRFVNDNVSVDVQKRLGIRYDINEDSILIPIVDLNNNLVGCKARVNSDDDYSSRFYAYLPYKKTSVVYGLNHNFKNISNKNTIVIFESEKSVGQCLSYGLGIGTAIGGHMISKTQSNIIKSLMVDNIIVAFDKGISEDEIRYEANKLKVDNNIYKNNVYYLYDKDGDYLKEKDSPSDNGKNILKEMIRNKIAI